MIVEGKLRGGVLMTAKNFHCETCHHNFEQAVLETVLTVLCPKCKRWVNVVEMVKEQGLTLGQSVFVAIVLYAIFG